MAKKSHVSVFLVITFILTNLFSVGGSGASSIAHVSPEPTAVADPASQELPTPPSLLPTDAEKTKARQSMEAALQKYLRYWGPRYQVAPLEVSVEGEWAYGVAHWLSQSRLLSGPIHVLAHRLPDGSWQALMPSVEGLYLEWLEAIPEKLVSTYEKNQIRTLAFEADALQQSNAVTQVPLTAATLGAEEEIRLVQGENVQNIRLPTPGSGLSQVRTVQGEKDYVNAPKVSIDFSWKEGSISLDVQSAIIDLLNKNLATLPPTLEYVLTVFDVSSDGNWARAVVLPRYAVEVGLETMRWEDVVEILLNRENKDSWKAYLFNTPEFLRIQSLVPEDFIDFFSDFEVTSVEKYKFPWAYGKQWWQTQNWHSSGSATPPFAPNNAVDFAPLVSEPDMSVLAASSGLLTTICEDGEIWLRTQNDDGYTGYGHIDARSINRSLIGKWIPQGTYIGRLYNPNSGGGYRTRCGWGTGPHIHFVFPHRNLTMYDLRTQRHVPAQEIGERYRVPYISNNYLVQPPGSPQLQTPADGSTINEGTSINLTWSSTGDEYFGEVWGGPGGTLTFGWQSATNRDLGIQPAGYTYSWRVRARNSAGESGWSNTWTFTVRPAAPSNLGTQVVSCSQVNLSWTDNSRNEEGYKIYRSGSYVGQVGADATSYQDTNLNGSTSYSYYVRAFRGNIESDSSNIVNITTPPCVLPKPDLVPSRWEGWQYPIVPSSITGTHVVNTLYAGYITYIDWGLTNAGNTSTGGRTYGALYIDDVRIGYYDFGDVQSGQTWAFLDWKHIVRTPGWHTLKFIADPDNLIAESDETNNVFQKDFYWVPSAPFSDSMEGGSTLWTTTGLWHLATSVGRNDSSAYWYGQDATGNYDTGVANSGSLTSPPIYISSTGLYLRFWYRYETETHRLDRDQRWVQISVDGGAFTNVLQLSDDPMMRWLQSPAIDLSPYVGRTIQVRFYFDTIDEAYNAYRGWYIDDFEISATPPPSCLNAYEPNNDPFQATLIAYGQSLNAEICPGGDFDFYKFTGQRGDKIVIDIDASTQGSLLDPYVFLLDSDGKRVLAQNDDEIIGAVTDSCLGYQLPRDGVYYIKVKASNHPSAGGSSYFYSIRLFTDNLAPLSATITSHRDGAWLNPVTETITAVATDGESGISRVEFFWHSADWQNSDWVWLGADGDGRDGWSWSLDTSSLSEQKGGAFYIWAFDWVGNRKDAGVWNLGIDRTAPMAEVIIREEPFSVFYVRWRGSDNLSGIVAYDVQYRDELSSEWTDLITNTIGLDFSFAGQNGKTYQFRVRAYDMAGNVGNYSDATTHTVRVCEVQADPFEADDTPANARQLETNGRQQMRNFHSARDRDWMKFLAMPGVSYTIATANVGGHADTVLYLYDRDGTTLLDSNDNDPDNAPASRLTWQSSAAGVYYIKVEHKHSFAYGCATVYGVSITPDRTIYRSYLPVVLIGSR